MKNELLIAALLHDIGWIYFRSGQKGEHAALGARLLEEINANHNFPIFLQDIISAVANHHPSLIDDKLVANNSLAHITLPLRPFQKARMTLPQIICH